MEQILLVRMVGQTLQKRKDNAVQIVGAMKRIVRLLHLVSVDHLLDHHTADRTSLSCSQIAVIALLEVDAQLAGNFVFHLVQRALGLRHDGAAAAGAGGRLLRVLLILRIILDRKSVV